MNQLPISNGTVFLDLNGVRAARGISADKVNQLVESGELLWVFNLAQAHGGKHPRNLRFWLPEIADARAVRQLSLDAVISKILPPGRSTINGAEIGRWFLVSRPTVKLIGKNLRGAVKNRLLHVRRDSLAHWLQQRWIGGAA
jgi:hypothetical protein